VPILFRKIFDRRHDKIFYPLSRLSKWKMFDNLRRSLVPPALMLLVFLSFSILPGSVFFWLGFFLLPQVFPLVMGVVGFNLEDNKLTNSFYDLLASEARQTSYICIAKGKIPASHWFKLGRGLTTVDHYKGLISWTGTMFEYLMPLLIMKSYQNTLLDETYSFVIKSQMKYGNQREMPWGTSESGYNAMDKHHDYKYKAIGVP
jgi:hypothetical protein